jgi:predicted  nucleic acid-binding Zn-ribbon protein
MDAVTSNHQHEIQQILKDAAARINKFKEDVEVRQTQLNQDHRLSVLQKKWDEEREAASQDVKNYKKKMDEREKRIGAEYQQKYDNLKGEVETMNGKFQERIREFESVQQSLKQQLSDAHLKSNSGMSEIQKNHEKEIQDLVRTSNEKYQNMIIEQLKLQENLRAEMNALIQQTKIDTTNFMQAEQDKVIGQLRAQLNGDRQEAIMKINRDHEMSMNNQKQEFMDKLEKAMSDLKSRTDELNKLRLEKDNLEATLKSQLKRVENELSANIRALEEKLRTAEEALNREKEQVRVLTSNVSTKEAEIASKVDQIRILMDEANGLKKSLADKQSECSTLRDELLRASQLGASSESALKEQMTAARKESDALKAEIAQLNSVIAGLRNDLKLAGAAAAKSQAEAYETISSLKSEVASLKARLEESLNSSKSSSQRANDELTQLRKTLSDREAAFKLEIEQKNASHAAAINDLREKHRLELEASTASRQELLDLAKRRESEVAEDMKKMASSHALQIEEIKGVYVETIKAMETDFDTQKSKMKATIAGLEAQISQLSEQADGEKGSLRGEVQRLDAKSKALQKDLDAKKKDAERIEGVCNGLKTQVESLREELKASQKAFREKMDMDLGKLDAEWTRKMEELQLKHAAELEENARDAAQNLQRQIDDLVKNHLEEIQSLKSALQKEASNASEEALIAERELLKLQSALEAEKKLHASNLDEANKLRANLLKEAEEKRTKDLENLRRELLSVAGQREQTLISSHTKEIEELRANWQQSITALTEQMASEQNSMRNDHAAILEKSLEQLRAQLMKEKAQALDESEMAHNTQIANLNNSTTRAVALLNQDIEGLKKSLSMAQQEITTIEKQLTTERMEKSRREEQFILEKDQMQREHQTDIRKERERSERTLMESAERASHEMKMLRDDMREEVHRHQEAMKHKQHEINILNEKILNRESRREDLEKIRQLQEDMVAKDLLVQQTKEEMLYFKREMLNREESYNTKFNRTPNVGVMNVLKTKDTNANNAPGARKGSMKPNGPVFGL